MNLTRETLSEPISTHINSYQQSMNQTQDRIKLLEHQYRKTDQFIISNEHLLEAKQNETQVTEVMENYRNEEAGQNSLVLAKGARRDREPSRWPWKKIMNLFNNNKAIKRYVRSHIVISVRNSSALKNISSFN